MFIYLFIFYGRRRRWPICWCCPDRGPGSFNVEDATTLSWSSAAVSELMNLINRLISLLARRIACYGVNHLSCQCRACLSWLSDSFWAHCLKSFLLWHVPSQTLSAWFIWKPSEHWQTYVPGRLTQCISAPVHSCVPSWHSSTSANIRHPPWSSTFDRWTRQLSVYGRAEFATSPFRLLLGYSDVRTRALP